MNIYLLKRNVYSWDETRAFVIIAPSKAEARNVAEKADDSTLWQDHSIVEVIQIGKARPSFTEAQVVLSDFVNG